MTKWYLVRRLIRFRAFPVSGLTGTALILAAAFSSTIILQASVSAAVEQSITTENGGRRFAVQVINQQRALPVLLKRADLLPVVDDTAHLSVPDADSPAALRVVADPAARLGLLIEGAYPGRPGEATVSSSLATSLGLHVGEEAVLVSSETREKQRVRISGVTASPARADDRTVVLMKGEVSASEATTFLTDVDPFADEQLGPLLNQRVLKGRTVMVFARDEGSAVRATLLSVLGYAAPALVVFSIGLILSLLALLTRGVSRDVSALQASGMAPVDSWRLVGYAAIFAVSAGTVLGIWSTLAAAALGRSYLSGLIGQDWQSVAVSWVPLVIYALSIPTLVLLVVLLLPPFLLGGRRRRLPTINLSPRLAASVIALWVVVVGLAVAQILPVRVASLWGAPQRPSPRR